MRILCRFNTGASLPEHARRLGEGEETRFSPLEIGAEYVVYGLKFRPNGLDYLVCPSVNGPRWMPGLLFEILDSTIPPWRVCLTEQTSSYKPLFTQYGITALIGYDELVSNPSHYDGILDRDPDQLKVFFFEKNKIDQWTREISMEEKD
jgi:hypothetical protein